MRRRRHAGGDKGLEESLLPPEDEQLQDDEANHGHPSSSGHSGQLIVYPGPFDLKKFILLIVEKCASTWSSFWQLLQHCYTSLSPWQGPRPVKLSLIQEERLERLWVSLGQPFSMDDNEHRQALRDLWSHAFPGEPCNTLKCDRWKDMGWQGDDPSTDIRGAGYFGVLNLLYLATRHPQQFDRLLHKRTGKARLATEHERQYEAHSHPCTVFFVHAWYAPGHKHPGHRSDWEYPFAAAGINLTFLLAEMLGFKRGPHSTGHTAGGGMPLERMQKQPAFSGFVSLLDTEEDGFQELYVIAFRTLDDRWLKAGASYMQFNAVMKTVIEDLTNALKVGPTSFEHLAILLGV